MERKKRVPELYYDGQFIDVLWDNHSHAVKWFEKYFHWNVTMNENWKVDPRCTEGIMTQMNYGTWLITYLIATRLPHHYADRGTVESNVRLCFRVHDLNEMHRILSDDGIRVSPTYAGPRTSYFDVWATAEGIRLTLQEDPSVPQGKVHPSWVRMGVSHLDQSIQWYQQHMGMKLVEQDEEGGFAIMSLKLNHSDGDSLWVLEKMGEDAYKGRVDSQVQPYCWIKDRDDFFNYHQYLNDSGIDTSEVGGFVTKGMVSFHFYDPDGNRLNISSM